MSAPAQAARPFHEALREALLFRHAPLVPVALAFTAGILIDRLWPLPFLVAFLAAIPCLALWALLPRPAAFAFMLATLVALGAAWHHCRHSLSADGDLADRVREQPVPATLRGWVDREPLARPAPLHDPLRTMDRVESTTFVLAASRLKHGDDWKDVTGYVSVTVHGPAPELNVGDEIEVVGKLSRPAGPSNPGERDWAEGLQDQGVRTQLSVNSKPGAITRLGGAAPWSFGAALSHVRHWAQRTLNEYLSPRTRAVGSALLLGEGAPMAQADWDKYMRTGVIHVLAISGQHLVILGGLFRWLLPRLGMRQRRALLVIALFLFLYALLTGGRPPVMRAAVQVGAVAVGALWDRRIVPVNAFALSWLVVGVLNPADILTPGCQLSFLAVAILYWGFARERPDLDPVAQLIDESRPLWWRGLRRVGGWVLEMYTVTLVMWLVLAPLIASRYHMVSPVGILLGPPVVVLTSIALVAGFLLLATAPIAPPVAAIFAFVVEWCLRGCEWLVDWGMSAPGGSFFVSDVPLWWVLVLYLGLAAMVSRWRELFRLRWRWGVVAALAWVCVGLGAGATPAAPGELRCTFLSVGHGGCTVIETPDGHVFLYDAGSLRGADVVKQQVAPFLWSRGIRHIDEVFVSHADLDHFNGLPELAERFAVGQVTTTPTFSRKDTPGVAVALEALQHRGVPVRTVKAGDTLRAGEVDFEVLHPPAFGPDGVENVRSLVLDVRYRERSILLTGDLEGAGLDRVLTLPRKPVDVMLAPHHGSLRSNTDELAAWAKPQVVVSSQGPPRVGRGSEPYSDRGARYLVTSSAGAVTVHCHADGLVVETFRTKERFVVRPR